MVKENYPVTGLIGKILKGEQKIKHLYSPPCKECRFYPYGKHKDKCDLDEVHGDAPYCSNFESPSVDEKTYRKLSES